MEREMCFRKDFSYEDEIPWVTSGLYDSKKDVYEIEKSKYFFTPEQEKKHQYHRQSEPFVSKIAEVSSPKSSYNAFTVYSRSGDEFEKICSLKESMRQTLRHPRSAENSPLILRQCKSSEKCFVVNLYIEGKVLHLGPFPFEVYPKMNVRLLKLKAEKELAIPTSFQKWILNKSLAIDNDLLLLNCDIVPGCPIFLYLDANFEKSIDPNKLHSLQNLSGSKNLHRCVDICRYVFEQCPVKANDSGGNRKVVLGSESYGHSAFKSISKNKYDEFMSINFGESDGIKKPELESEDCLPAEDVTALKHRKKFSGTKKGPFKPVFAKMKENGRALLNNANSSNVECSTKTAAAVILPSIKTSKNSISSSDDSVSKNIFKLQVGADEMQLDFNVINSSPTSVLSQKGIEPQKHEAFNIQESLPSSSLDKVSILSPKRCRNSILEKVRTRSITKLKRENEKSATTERTQGILSNVLEKSIKISAEPVDDKSSFQHDILVQHNYETECHIALQGVSPKVLSELERNSNDINKEALSTVSEGRPDSTESNKVVVQDSKAENLTASSEPDSLESSNTAFSESEITEICIVNNSDGFSPELHKDSANSTNPMDNIEQNRQEEENKVIIKKCAENYEHLLKMEDLNLVRNVLNFTCPVCFGDFESDQGVVLHECLHTFCIECLARTINYAEEVLVKCPYRDDEYSCPSYLQQREIKALVSPEIYERYLQRSIITAESLTEKSFHCKTPDCPGWCVFDDNINVYHCPVCFHYNCLNCRTIHEGLNCRQYQDKLQSQKKLDPDSEKTLEFLNKMIETGKALKCPKCDLILMKKWGCDWLKCAVCLTEICWITKGPRWGPGGQGDTSAGCRCGVNGVKCHPSCTYCH